MFGRLSQLSEPRLRQQAGIEKSQTSVESVILVKWVRLVFIFTVLVVDLFAFLFYLPSVLSGVFWLTECLNTKSHINMEV